MIEVDISNVWGQLALPDLLAMERDVFDAHSKLMGETGEEGNRSALPEFPLHRDGKAVREILACAEKIRSESEVCVVADMGGSYPGVRAAMELLQGEHRNTGRGKGDPRICFTGNNLSTRHWKQLQSQLEEKDFSIIVISGAELPAQTGISLRSLRWMLERKYGTDEANSRIYAVTDPEQGALRQMAREAGWQSFEIPDNVQPRDSLLTAAGLLPMAVAGLDIEAFLAGAAAGKAAWDLRSYENPVWLYAAVRKLLYRKGRQTELLASFEPGFRSFGGWWQQLFLRDGKGAFPVAAEYPADLYFAQQGDALFETLVRFAPGEADQTIISHWKDLDGLNALAGKTLDHVQEQAYTAALSAHGEADIPVITIDCGVLSAHTLGELVYFLELACGISDSLPRL